jgi:hypothetical protein
LYASLSGREFGIIHGASQPCRTPCPYRKANPMPRNHVHCILLFVLLAGCATGGDLVPLGDSAWRVTTIDNTGAEAERLGIVQADRFCAKMGKTPVYSPPRTYDDMPARYNSTLEFQCAPRGNSPDAQAEARVLGYRRDCAIAGFALGSPENLKCAADIAAKSSPRAVPAR